MGKGKGPQDGPNLGRDWQVGQEGEDDIGRVPERGEEELFINVAWMMRESQAGRPTCADAMGTIDWSYDDPLPRSFPYPH